MYRLGRMRGVDLTGLLSVSVAVELRLVTAGVWMRREPSCGGKTSL